MAGTYWDCSGLHQDKGEALERLVPTEGPVRGKANAALERFRRASNAYYDLYNNGGWNRRGSIVHLFGRGPKALLAMGEETRNRIVESTMDSIILAAWDEQVALGRIVPEEG
jgi:hypothetical protein